jgi:signal transduction histidine kinase/CheY-like chemotaxis protein
MRKLLFSSVLVLLSVLTANRAIAQVDQQVQTRFESFLSQRKFESALALADSLIRSTADSSFTQAAALLMKAVALQSQKKLTPASHIADSLLQNGSFKSHPELEMKALLVLGNVNYSRFRQKEATYYYLKIDSLADVHKIGRETQIKALTNLGTLMISAKENRDENYLQSGDFYYSKGLQLALETGDSTGYYDLSTYVATQDFGKGKLDSIETIYTEAIRFFERKGDEKLLTSTLWGLGWAYESEGELEKAKETYLRNIQQNAQNPQNINGNARAHWIYANFLNRMEDYEGSIREFETARQLFLSEEEQDIGPLNGTTYNLATLYRKVGRDREAYEFLEKAWVMQDSIDRAMEYDQLQELETKYQTAQKDKEIAALQIVSQRRKFQLVMGILILAVAVVGFLIYLYYQRKKLELARRITELDQIKSSFFENISHEFRTPLTLIDSPLQVLEKDPTISEESSSKLALIRKQSNRLLELVNQILSVNQLKNGEIQVLLKKGILRQPILSLLEPFEVEAKEKGLVWETAVDFSDQSVWFDSDLIQKILSNLLGNAVKYTPKGGKIGINSSADLKLFHFKIQNTAPELRPQEVKRIFDRFYQNQQSNPGFGIGLSLVDQLVKRLNGTIEAAKVEDQLVIELTLPVALDLLPQHVIVLDEESENVTFQQEISPNQESPILLIAEDHPDTRVILHEIFKNDYQVIPVSNGEEAWKICQEIVPDLIVSDVAMPEVGGLELCRRIKTHEFLSHIPVFLLTASARLSTQLAGSEAEADGYMSKPFNHELLAQEIKKLIAQRKKLRDRYSKEVILRPVDLAINSVEERFLEKLQEVVSGNFENPDFSAEDFAMAMDMSRMQLHRKLKHLTGYSAMEFLKDQRLKTAASLLKRSDLSVSDVAYSVGFNDLSHFSKSFKASFGLSPTEYQQAT